MHADEFEIDAALVKHLIEKQFPAWADLPIKPVLSSGTDNALFRLGNEMVIRLPRIDWAVDAIEKECEWLPKLAPFLPFSIPALLGKGVPAVEFPWPWAVYRWLEGSNPVVGNIQNPIQLTQDLASFIQSLQKIHLLNGPISNRGVPLEKQDVEVRKALQQLDGMIDIPAVTAIWEMALQTPKWAGHPVWVHGDLSPGNILTQNGRLSAVIDFGILGIGDPACDMIIAWTLLPAQMRTIFRKALGVDDATWKRGRGWALSNALIALPYYKDTNPYLANNARHVIREIIKEECKNFSFEQAKESQRDLIHHWLKQDHIKEWIHGIGLQNTLNGMEKFFRRESNTAYWIGYDQETPFAFLITSPEGNDAITLDVFICDLDYLGKGFSVPMIREFLISQFPKVNRVLIDPEATNKRAIHVYQKVGFKIIDEFIAAWHPVPHYQMELNMNIIELAPYNSQWPKMFASEAEKLKQTLGDNCLAIHHVGSTAVPGLSSKPIIDILPVVRNIQLVDAKAMESLGYESKGEYGIAFRRYFQKDKAYHVHVYQDEDPEISRYLKFRDWMRSHPHDAEAYAKLKQELAASSQDILHYCNGKDAFVASIDAKDGYDGWRMVQALTDREWTAVRKLRQNNFFKSQTDPYAWTFTHKDHIHFVFYKNAEIIGYAHLQLWPENRAALRIIAIEEQYRNFGYGSQMLNLCERWLAHQGFQQLLVQSSPAAYKFYCKQGYIHMPFKDPDGYASDPQDIEIGKLL